MKRLLIVGSLLLWFGYVTATAFLSGFAGSQPQTGLGVLFNSGAVVAIVSSLITSRQIATNLGDPATEAGRRYYRRLALAFVTLLATSIVLTVIASVARQAPAWVPIALSAITIVSATVPVIAAEHYRRQLPANKVRGDDWRVGADDRARTFRKVAVTFVVATAVAVALLTVLVGTKAVDHLSAAEIASFSLATGAFAALVPSIGPGWRLTTSSNLIFGTDIESYKAVAGLVLRDRHEELSDEQRTMAAEFAHVWRELMPIQFAQVMLMIAAFSLTYVPLLLNDGGETWISVLLLALLLFLIAGLVISRIRYQRVRRYAAAHPIQYLTN